MANKEKCDIRAVIGCLCSLAAVLFATALPVQAAQPHQQILGKAVNFGIVAGKYTQNNDLESNFATNLFKGIGQTIHPDLTGNEPGDIIISDIDPSSANLKIGSDPYSVKSVFYIAKELHHENKIIYDDHLTAKINKTYTKKELEAQVGGMIGAALKQGESLAKKKATIAAGPEPDNPCSGKVLVDAAASAQNLVYVDGEDVRSALSESDKVIVKKRPEQTVVFNFTSNNGTSLTLGQYAMVIQDGSQTTHLNSAPATTDLLREQSKRIVFNVAASSGIEDVRFKNTAGIFLLNGANGHVDSTSCGWVVTNKAFENANGEWHNIYPQTQPYHPTEPKPVKPKHRNQPIRPNKPVTPAKPTSPEKPAIPSAPSKTVKQTRSVQAAPKTAAHRQTRVTGSKYAKPETGDSTAVYLYAALIIAAAVIAACVVRHTQKHS